MKTYYDESEIELSYNPDSMIGLIADAIGDATSNDEDDIRKQIEAGRMSELVTKIQDVMISYGVKNEDAYANSTVNAIKDKLQWMADHPYKKPSDAQINEMVHKLVWSITKRYRGGQIVAVKK